MDRSEIITMLNCLQIKYTLREHPPAETIDEIDTFNLPDSDTIVKNLFVRDDKKRNYYLLVVQKDRKVNLKQVQELLGSRPLSFASENDLFSYLGLKKGHVTPFGILNDMSCKVQVIIDESILNYPFVGVHPNDNTATLWLSPGDLQKIVETHGNNVSYIKLTEKIIEGDSCFSQS